jgi:hypothetical protein
MCGVDLMKGCLLKNEPFRTFPGVVTLFTKGKSMKKYFVMMITVLSATSAMAADAVFCKSPSKAVGQGYEVVLMGKKAEVLVNGRKVADLIFQRKVGTGAGDQTISSYYFEPRANGYQLMVTEGGLMGATIVTISRGGFAGYTTVARLTDCN